MPDPINNHMFGPNTNQMADLSTNQLMDPSTNQLTDLSASHTQQMMDPLANPMADPSTYYELVNDPLADPNTYFGPANSHMAGPNGYYGPPVNQVAGPGPYYGMLNPQMAGPNGFYGPVNPQMAGVSSYYGPVNHAIAGPNGYFGLVNQQMAAPNGYFGMLNQQYMGPPFEQDDETGAYIQNLSNQLPINDAWAAAAAIGEPTDSPQLNTNGALCMQQKSVSFADGDGGYDLEESSTAAARPPQTPTIRHKKAKDALDSEPYIKKPPNAFMLFMQEQRPKVVSECNIKNNAAVNAILGKRWKSMSREEQAPYYEQACKEKLIHIQQHPNWCHMDNYGRKRKRVRGKAALRAKASAAKCEEEGSESRRGLKGLPSGGPDAEPDHSPTSGAPHHPPPTSLPDPSRRCLSAPPSIRELSASDGELVSLTQAEEFLKMLDDIELPVQAARAPAKAAPPKTPGGAAAAARGAPTPRNARPAARCPNRGDFIQMRADARHPSPPAHARPETLREIPKGSLASLLHPPPPHVSEFCHAANHEDELQLILEHLGYQH